MLLPLLLSACGGKAQSDANSIQSDEAKPETVSWYAQQKQQGWFKKQNGSISLLSDNYHVIDGRPIAVTFSIINAGGGVYIAALVLTDVSKNVDTEGERCPSLDESYPRVGMMFDGEALQWTTERPAGSAVALCYDKDADELLAKLFETQNFNATVRLADGSNLEYKFKPYRQK